MLWSIMDQLGRLTCSGWKSSLCVCVCVFTPLPPFLFSYMVLNCRSSSAVTYVHIPYPTPYLPISIVTRLDVKQGTGGMVSVYLFVCQCMSIHVFIN